MFAVIGEWRMSTDLDGAQREGLTRIAAAVGRRPGLDAGYWTRSADGTTSHTFIVFSDRAQAVSFAAVVSGNHDQQRAAGVQNLSLTIEEITARAPARPDSATPLTTSGRPS